MSVTGSLEKEFLDASFLEKMRPFERKIFASANVPEFREKQIKRTWMERLFSLPWRPRLKHKYVKERTAFFMDGHCYVNENTFKMMLAEQGPLLAQRGVADGKEAQEQEAEHQAGDTFVGEIRWMAHGDPLP